MVGWQEKERKLTSPNTLPAVLRTKGLSNSREKLAGGGLARGRRQGGGERGKLSPRDGLPHQTANRLPVSNQRLLRLWMVDIRREGRG